MTCVSKKKRNSLTDTPLFVPYGNLGRRITFPNDVGALHMGPIGRFTMPRMPSTATRKIGPTDAPEETNEG